MTTILLVLGLLQVVASLSLRRNATENTDALINVESIQISPSYTGGAGGAQRPKLWRVAITFGKGRYITMNLSEIWQLNGIVATEGVVYEQLNGWVACGYARLSLSMSELFAQGVFTINQHRMHLHRRQGQYKILNEEPLQKSAVIPKYEDLGERYTEGVPLLLKRELSDSPGLDTTPWPTFGDLRASANNASVCYSKRHLAAIGVAADSNFISSFESSQAAQLHIVDTVNKASQVWENAFNISLSLSEIVMGDSGTSYSWNVPCNSSDNTMNSLESRLNALSDWRKATRPWDGLALWSLFSDCPSSEVIGLAWQSTACKPGGVNILHHSVLDYQILAHESGHVFGAVHDCVNTTCASKAMSASYSQSSKDSGTICCPYTSSQCDSKGKYIMSPGSEIYQQVFSRCSQGNVCSAISNSHINSSCLVEDTNNSGFYQPYCSSIADPDKYERCLRDVQCWDSTNQKSSSSCGSLDDCTLSCLNEQTGKCEKLDVLLIHQSGCNYKSTAGSNHHTIPNWGWALIAIGCISAAAVSITLLLMYLIRTRKERKADAPFPGDLQKKIKVGPPSVQKKHINREPITGLPPMLPYNVYRGPSTPTMKATYMDTDNSISSGSPYTRRSSSASSSYSASDPFELKQITLD